MQFLSVAFLFCSSAARISWLPIIQAAFSFANQSCNGLSTAINSNDSWYANISLRLHYHYARGPCIILLGVGGTCRMIAGRSRQGGWCPPGRFGVASNWFVVVMFDRIDELGRTEYITTLNNLSESKERVDGISGFVRYIF